MSRRESTPRVSARASNSSKCSSFARAHSARVSSGTIAPDTTGDNTTKPCTRKLSAAASMVSASGVARSTRSAYEHASSKSTRNEHSSPSSPSSPSPYRRTSPSSLCTARASTKSANTAASSRSAINNLYPPLAVISSSCACSAAVVRMSSHTSASNASVRTTKPRARNALSNAAASAGFRTPNAAINRVPPPLFACASTAVANSSACSSKYSISAATITSYARRSFSFSSHVSRRPQSSALTRTSHARVPSNQPFRSALPCASARVPSSRSDNVTDRAPSAAHAKPTAPTPAPSSRTRRSRTSAPSRADKRSTRA